MQERTIQESWAHGVPQHGYRGRVRSGCLTCRSRKVKCDERRPFCNNCTRLNRQCVYKPRTNNRLSATTPVPGQAAPTEAGTETEVRAATETPSSAQISPPSNLEEQNCVTEEILRLDNAAVVSWGGVQDPFLFPDSSIGQLYQHLENSLQREDEVSITTDHHDSDEASHSTLISRDIKLTTTMDILAAHEISSQPWFSFFVESVECPCITPFDSLNWQRMKLKVVELAVSNAAVSSAIRAVSILYKAQLFTLPFSRATVLYNSSKVMYKKLLEDDDQDFDLTLAATFLLCLFEFVHCETVPILKEPGNPFLQKLRAWAEHGQPHSDFSLRIIAWLRLLRVTTLRGGGMGLISDEVCSLFPGWKTGIPNLKSPNHHHSDSSTQIYEVLSTPIFDFYFQLQMTSGGIARLTHYHRSRATGEDQEDVTQQISRLKSQIQSLWENRSATQRQTPGDLRSHLAPQIANPIIALIGVCSAAYYAEIVEMDRVLGDPVSESTAAKHARRHIRDLVDGDWNALEGGKINTGYLRPLFLYAIECMDSDENHWAVENLERIKNPICRSSFFASFGKELSDAQLRKGRRVTSKYFCVWSFGVPPPFM